MTTQPGPYAAFLSALQDAYAASGVQPNTFTPGAQGVPGQPGQAQGDSSGGVVSGGLGGGAGGASVPGTATTGQNLLEDILNGGDLAAPENASLVNRLFGVGGVPGERGDLGAGVTGGNAGALLATLSGLGAVPTVLSSLVASDALGLPLDPSLLTAQGLAGLSASQPSDAFDRSVAAGAEIGGNVGGPAVIGSPPVGGGAVGNLRTGVVPRPFGVGGRLGGGGGVGGTGQVSRPDTIRSETNREAGGGFTR